MQACLCLCISDTLLRLQPQDLLQDTDGDAHLEQGSVLWARLHAEPQLPK